MKKLILTIFTVIAFSLAVQGQRCKGHILFRILDNSEKLIYPQIKDPSIINNPFKNLDVVCDSISKFGKIGFKNYRAKTIPKNCPGIERRDNIFYYSQKTGCGIKSWTFDIVKNRKTMTITIKNAEMENEYFLSPIRFRKGNFILDLDEVNKKNKANANRLVDTKEYLKRD